MAHQRLIWADSLKGWLIILVVLGHAIQNTLGEVCETNHLWNIIYSFHMAAFMAISGYVAFRPDNSWDGTIVKSTICRRFRQLIVPFILWTIITLLLERRISIVELWSHLIYPDKGLWFLWVLFFINILFILGSYFAKKLEIAQEIAIISICVWLVVVMVIFEVRAFGFQFIAYYFLFYSLGYFFHKHEWRVAASSPLLLAIMAICWAVLAWFWKMHELPEFMKGLPLPATLTQYVYRFITAAIAVYLLLDLSPRVLSSSHQWNKLFVKLGSVSLGIYAVHFLFLGLWIGLFKGMNIGNGCVIVCAFISTLAATWLVVWLLSKWKLTETWLLGKI